MKILVLNVGSTSYRFSLYEMENEKLLVHGGCEEIGKFSSYFILENSISKNKINVEIKNHNDAIDYIVSTLISNKYISNINQIDAIGFRIVHGGCEFVNPMFIDDVVLEKIKKLSVLDVAHGENTVRSIEYFKNNLMQNNNMIAVFDTSFHQSIPKENYIYAIPGEWYEDLGIRKYGFHGISFQYVLKKYIEITKQSKNKVNVVMCHLGGGSSICAVKNGLSIDTTMEFSPLTGMIMANRSGSIDPSIIPIVSKKYNISCDKVVHLLNSVSGYYAIANDNSAKSIIDRSIDGDEKCQFLLKVLEHDFKKNLFAMMSNLESIDSIIMTGTISSKNKEFRKLFLRNLDYYGIALDLDKNDNLFDCVGVISKDSSKIPIYIIPSNEELEIAIECKKLMNSKV